MGLVMDLFSLLVGDATPTQTTPAAEPQTPGEELAALPFLPTLLQSLTAASVQPVPELPEAIPAGEGDAEARTPLPSSEVTPSSQKLMAGSQTLGETPLRNAADGPSPAKPSRARSLIRTVPTNPVPRPFSALTIRPSPLTFTTGSFPFSRLPHVEERRGDLGEQGAGRSNIPQQAPDGEPQDPIPSPFRLTQRAVDKAPHPVPPRSPAEGMVVQEGEGTPRNGFGLPRPDVAPTSEPTTRAAASNPTLRAPSRFAATSHAEAVVPSAPKRDEVPDAGVGPRLAETTGAGATGALHRRWIVDRAVASYRFSRDAGDSPPTSDAFARNIAHRLSPDRSLIWDAAAEGGLDYGPSRDGVDRPATTPRPIRDTVDHSPSRLSLTRGADVDPPPSDPFIRYTQGDALPAPFRHAAGAPSPTRPSVHPITRNPAPAHSSPAQVNPADGGEAGVPLPLAEGAAPSQTEMGDRDQRVTARSPSTAEPVGREAASPLQTDPSGERAVAAERPPAPEGNALEPNRLGGRHRLPTAEDGAKGTPLSTEASAQRFSGVDQAADSLLPSRVSDRQSEGGVGVARQTSTGTQQGDEGSTFVNRGTFPATAAPSANEEAGIGLRTRVRELTSASRQPGNRAPHPGKHNASTPVMADSPTPQPQSAAPGREGVMPAPPDLRSSIVESRPASRAPSERPDAAGVEHVPGQKSPAANTDRHNALDHHTPPLRQASPLDTAEYRVQTWLGGNTGAGEGTNAPTAVVHLARLPAQVAEHLSRAAQAGRTTVRLRLHPPELGHLEIRLRLNGNDLNVYIETADGAVKELIETQLEELRTALEGRGLHLERLSVTLPPTVTGTGDLWPDGRSGGREPGQQGSTHRSSAQRGTDGDIRVVEGIGDVLDQRAGIDYHV